MAWIESFGAYLPPRIVTNQELALQLGCEADWIATASGIQERRWAEPEDPVAELAVGAARDCLRRAGVDAQQIGMVIVASGSSPRRFPGPASSIAHRLGLGTVPAIDVPMASAGSLFALALAADLASNYERILVIAAEKMSSVIRSEPMDRNVAILFGDGAGAALVNAAGGFARLIDSRLHSSGEFAEDLRLEFTAPLFMNGRTVILQAGRKIPAVISEVLERNHRAPSDIAAFVMHQANQNLIDRVAASLGVPAERFFSNIALYGNTSSASMLIAASEWWPSHACVPGPVCFAGFGAGFHWGAVLAEVTR